MWKKSTHQRQRIECEKGKKGATYRSLCCEFKHEIFCRFSFLIVLAEAVKLIYLVHTCYKCVNLVTLYEKKIHRRRHRNFDTLTRNSGGLWQLLFRRDEKFLSPTFLHSLRLYRTTAAAFELFFFASSIFSYLHFYSIFPSTRHFFFSSVGSAFLAQISTPPTQNQNWKVSQWIFPTKCVWLFLLAGPIALFSALSLRLLCMLISQHLVSCLTHANSRHLIII